VCIVHAYGTVMTYLCLELGGGAHGLDFGNLRLQHAAMMEELKGQVTTLFRRCTLLPAIWNSALLLLDTIVPDELIESHSGSILLHAILLHVGLVQLSGPILLQ